MQVKIAKFDYRNSLPLPRMLEIWDDEDHSIQIFSLVLEETESNWSKLLVHRHLDLLSEIQRVWNVGTLRSKIDEASLMKVACFESVEFVKIQNSEKIWLWKLPIDTIGRFNVLSKVEFLHDP